MHTQTDGEPENIMLLAASDVRAGGTLVRALDLRLRRFG